MTLAFMAGDLRTAQQPRSARLLVVLALVVLVLSALAGTAGLAVAIAERSQGPRGTYLLLSYGLAGWTISAMAASTILHKSGRHLTGLIVAERPRVSRLTWFVGGYGLLLTISLAALAITMGTGPASIVQPDNGSMARVLYLRSHDNVAPADESSQFRRLVEKEDPAGGGLRANCRRSGGGKIAVSCETGTSSRWSWAPANSNS